MREGEPIILLSHKARQMHGCMGVDIYGVCVKTKACMQALLWNQGTLYCISKVLCSHYSNIM